MELVMYFPPFFYFKKTPFKSHLKAIKQTLKLKGLYNRIYPYSILPFICPLKDFLVKSIKQYTRIETINFRLKKDAFSIYVM